MNKNYLLLAVTGFAFFGLMLSSAYAAQSTAELQAQLASLLSQLESLKNQAQQTSTAPTASAIPTPKITRNLFIGYLDTDTGGEVSRWQDFLISESRGSAAVALKKEFDKGIKKGKFGGLTGKATEEWQKANGLTSTFPGVGPKTRQLLASVISQRATTVSTPAVTSVVALPLVPIIVSVSPANGKVGDTITIRGTGFTADGNDIYFDFPTGKNILIYSADSPSGTAITFVIPQYGGQVCPSNAVCAPTAYSVLSGNHMVSVKNSTGSSNESAFTIDGAPVQAGKPQILGYAPKIAPVGSTLTVQGTGFLSDKNTVYFSSSAQGTGALPDLPSPDGKSITFTIPDTIKPACIFQTTPCVQPDITIDPGLYQVSVSNANGTSDNMNFTVSQPPAVFGVSPSSASPGSSIVIIGSSFDYSMNTVIFKGSSGKESIVLPSSVNRTVITYTIPKDMAPDPMPSCASDNPPCPVGRVVTTAGSYTIQVTHVGGSSLTFPITIIGGPAN